MWQWEILNSPINGGLHGKIIYKIVDVQLPGLISRGKTKKEKMWQKSTIDHDRSPWVSHFLDAHIAELVTLFARCSWKKIWKRYPRRLRSNATPAMRRRRGAWWVTAAASDVSRIFNKSIGDWEEVFHVFFLTWLNKSGLRKPASGHAMAVAGPICKVRRA